MTDAPLTCSLQLTIENVNGSDTSSTSITVSTWGTGGAGLQTGRLGLGG